MLISAIMMKMIQKSEGNLEDINHFMKVYTYARTIGLQENLDPVQQEILEISAIIHDISCPLCRQKYGNANGKLQEKESPALVYEFLSDFSLPEGYADRIAFLISHHHTIDQIDGMDYQILIEADYLVNADEGGYSKENIQTMLETVFQTDAGKTLLRSEFHLAPPSR